MSGMLNICRILIMITALMAPLFADTVHATGAGPLPASAQDLSGDNSLSEIVGTLDFPDGVNVFKIDIVYPLGFSAFTVPLPFGVADPELFLFDANALGVYSNDDATPIDLQSCLPSALSSNPCPSPRDGVGPTTAGIYYLAITRSENEPLSSAGYIFTPVLSTDVVGPDLTMGGGSPITGWDGGVNTSPDFDLINYDIMVQDVPEPPLVLLTAFGLAGIVAGSRKRGPQAA